MKYRPKSALFSLLLLVFFALPTLAAKPQFIIGFPEDNMSNDWRAAQMKQIQEELAKHSNVKFLMADAGGSVAQNIRDIEHMVEQGAQLLFLGPRDPDAIALVIKQIRKKGVHIVLLTRQLNSDDYDTFISPDDFKIGYEAAAFLAEKLNGRGRVLMLEGVPTTSTSMRRKNGFIIGLENFTGMEVISKVANYSRNEAIKVVEKTLAEGVKFDAIFALNDAMAAGARVVMKNKGISPDSLPTVGIDFLPETRQAIIKGDQLASFTYPTCGKEGVAAALDLLNGKKVRRYIPVPFQLVTRENVNKVEAVY